MKYVRFYDSPAGKLALVTDGQALNALLLEREAQEENVTETGGKMPEKAEEIFALTAAWLDEYFAGKNLQNPQLKKGSGQQKTYTVKVGGKTLLLRPEGSEFRQEVWRILCEIPYGKTVTYGDIAEEMGRIRNKKKMAAQAVGGAVGHNPIGIMIPCHRVVGTGGSLTGYGGGLPVKIQLLELEGLDRAEFTIPTKGTKL